MTENAELYAEAMLGSDAESFLASDIGRFIVGRAEQESAAAMDELKRCPALDSDKITELQNRIWRAESVQQWLGELIIQGRQALQQLEQAED